MPLAWHRRQPIWSSGSQRSFFCRHRSQGGCRLDRYGRRIGDAILNESMLAWLLGTDGDRYTDGGRFAGKRCAKKIHNCSIRESECKMADD